MGEKRGREERHPDVEGCIRMLLLGWTQMKLKVRVQGCIREELKKESSGKQRGSPTGGAVGDTDPGSMPRR